MAVVCTGLGGGSLGRWMLPQQLLVWMRGVVLQCHPLQGPIVVMTIDCLMAKAAGILFKMSV